MDIEDLYRMTAPILTEQRTKLELVEDIPGRLGQCYKKSGAFVIEIKTGSLYAGFMNVFLHECAHIYLRANNFLDLGLYKLFFWCFFFWIH